MADSKKEEEREDDDHPFDYTDSKKEEVGHDDEEEAGHDDIDHPFDYTDSKKEEGHEDDEVNDDEEDDGDENDDDDPFDYNLQLVIEAANDAWKEDFPDNYPCDGEERSPPLQSPQDGSHGIAKVKPRSSPKKRSEIKMGRASPPASSSSSDDKLMKSLSSSSSLGKAKMQETASTSHTTDSGDDGSDNDPFRNIDVLADVATDIWFEETSEAAPSRAIPERRRGPVSRSRSRSNNGNAGADLAADHPLPPPPAAPQAGRTWREVHREMGGGEVVWIGKKTVHMSDKAAHQGRLLLPQGLEAQVYKHVLPREKEKIDSDAGLQVDVLDFYGERFELTCKYRKCQKGMVFNGGWTRFLRQHEARHLREGESLLLLAFRSQLQRLFFVFVPQHLEDEDQQQRADDQD